MASVPRLQEARNLQAEAEELETSLGPNAYSTYLRQHHRRPPKEDAATIGRLLSGRVRADDGSMQPRPTAAERKALKARRDAFTRRYEQVMSLEAAIAALAQLPDDPTDLVSDFESSDIAAKADAAVCWLRRFVDQCHVRKQIKNAANSNAYCRSNEQGDAQRCDP
jgi:hypothetical protein